MTQPLLGFENYTLHTNYTKFTQTVTRKIMFCFLLNLSTDDMQRLSAVESYHNGANKNWDN